jgi:hypothetical protein
MRTIQVISIIYLVYCKYCLANGKEMLRETVTFESDEVPTRGKPVDERINLTFPGL